MIGLSLIINFDERSYAKADGLDLVRVVVGALENILQEAEQAQKQSHSIKEAVRETRIEKRRVHETLMMIPGVKFGMWDDSEPWSES